MGIAAEKKYHYYNIGTGLTEFIMVSSLHTIVPISVPIGHIISGLAFLLYATLMMAHIRHSLVMVRASESTD